MQWTLDEVVRVNVYTSTGNMALESTVMSSSAVDRAGRIRTTRQTGQTKQRNVNTVLKYSTARMHARILCRVHTISRVPRGMPPDVWDNSSGRGHAFLSPSSNEHTCTQRRDSDTQVQSMLRGGQGCSRNMAPWGRGAREGEVEDR